MECINNVNEISSIKDNRVIIDSDAILELVNSKIIFRGKNNIIKIKGRIRLVDSVIEFMNDNSIVYLNDNPFLDYKISARLFNKCTLYFGKNNYFNRALSVSVDEMKTVFIGDDCLFSFGIWLRTGDPHIIYDADSYKRLNHSKSIFIGDHVWCGQNSLILKNSRIGSGSIIGANAVISGKAIESNTVYAGNPGKRIKENIFFLRKAVHDFTEELQGEYEEYKKDNYIYNKDVKTQSFDKMDKEISLMSIDERISYFDSLIDAKNRFYI